MAICPAAYYSSWHWTQISSGSMQQWRLPVAHAISTSPGGVTTNEYGLRVRKEKCKFFSPSVEFRGYRIDAEGRHPLDSKLHAITEAPEERT